MHPPHGQYTHFTSTGASRIDRIYVTRNLRTKQRGVETLAAAFTDHFAVSLRLSLDASSTLRGKGYWKMNISYFSEPDFQQTIKGIWAKWQEHIKYYPNKVMLWGRYVKSMLRQMFCREGVERRRDRVEMENFYYTAIYDVLQNKDPHAVKASILNKLQAKIVRLHSVQRMGAFLDTGEQDRMLREEPSLHHLLKGWKRQEHRTIHQIYDNIGIQHVIH